MRIWKEFCLRRNWIWKTLSGGLVGVGIWDRRLSAWGQGYKTRSIWLKELPSTSHQRRHILLRIINDQFNTSCPPRFPINPSLRPDRELPNLPPSPPRIPRIKIHPLLPIPITNHSSLVTRLLNSTCLSLLRKNIVESPVEGGLSRLRLDTQHRKPKTPKTLLCLEATGSSTIRIA
jgi:hypothetical protein